MQHHRFSSFGSPFRFSGAVIPLIALNVAVFLLQEVSALNNPLFARDLSRMFGLVPAAFFGGAVWQVVTYMFLHGGFWHILFNMFVLWMFGTALENAWGSREFLKYYFITGIGGGLCYALFNIGSPVPTIGASGAIYGLLAAYAILYPNNIIYLWMVIPVRAKWFAVILGVIELYFSLVGGGGIAHLAHLGGMVMGVLYLWRERMFPALFASNTSTERRVRREMIARWKEVEELDQLRREVDELLDKINHHGLDSLTPAERKRLDKASKILREKESRP
ncbi:MAG: rhomboid family intramembrane serine protease [bacterium]|nr:rhomboid family intramembrane serine protease [bacterium]